MICTLLCSWAEKENDGTCEPCYSYIHPRIRSHCSLKSNHAMILVIQERLLTFWPQFFGLHQSNIVTLLKVKELAKSRERWQLPTKNLTSWLSQDTYVGHVSGTLKVQALNHTHQKARRSATPPRLNGLLWHISGNSTTSCFTPT